MSDEVFFLRRARPGLIDLWTEAIDWAPTMLTTIAVLLAPYLFAHLLEAGRPALFSGEILRWFVRDHYVRGIIALGLAALACLWLWQTGQLVLERARVVRMDLHEIECWPDRQRRHLLVRDVVGARAGRNLPQRPQRAQRKLQMGSRSEFDRLRDLCVLCGESAAKRGCEAARPALFNRLELQAVEEWR